MSKGSSHKKSTEGDQGEYGLDEFEGVESEQAENYSLDGVYYDDEGAGPELMDPEDIDRTQVRPSYERAKAARPDSPNSPFFDEDSRDDHHTDEQHAATDTEHDMHHEGHDNPDHDDDHDDGPSAPFDDHEFGHEPNESFSELSQEPLHDDGPNAYADDDLTNESDLHRPQVLDDDLTVTAPERQERFPKDDTRPGKNRRATKNTRRSTDPAQGRSRRDKKTVSHKRPRPEPLEDTSTLAQLRENFSDSPWRKFLAPGIAVLATLAFLISLSGDGGIDPDLLGTFLQQVQQKDFTGASISLSELEAPEALHGQLLDSLNRSKNRSIDSDKRKAKERYRQKKFGEALVFAQAVAKIAPSADMEYIVAESLRHMGRTGPALTAYGVFTERYPTDKRYDDALYWQAESAFTQGQVEQAKSLWGKILSLDKSNFKRSAQRRIEEVSK